MDMPWNLPNAVTPAEVLRRRQLAQALQGDTSQYGNPLGALAQGLRGSIAGFEAKTAADLEGKGQAGFNAKLAAALAGDPSVGDLAGLAGDPWMTGGQGAIVQSLIKQQIDPDDGPGAESFFGNGIPIRNADGSIAYGQFGNQGSFNVPELPPGASFLTPVQQLDTGTGYTGVDKFGNPIQGPNAVTPIDNRGAAFDTELGKGEGSAAAEKPMRMNKAIVTMQQLDAQRAIVNDDIDRVVTEMTNNPWFTSGAGAALTAWAPGSPGQAVAEKLKTIGANVGFDKLQAMREASPTGGALGQVSDFENRQLQAILGSLEQSQQADDILYNLKRLKDFLATSTTIRQDAFSRDFGAQEAPTQTDLVYNPATGQLE